MENVRIYPDPILRKKAQAIENIDGRVKDIADRMAQVMRANKGIGLAAPQIGIPQRIIIVDIGEGVRTLINPEVVDEQGESIMVEGCLSLPNIEILVKRKEKVIIRGWNLEGKEVNLEFIGFPGRVYQHEIDHLNGILIIHHISRLKRELLIKKVLKDIRRSPEKGSIL
jgi:peptide deformylase